jgi:hypothetical protein
MTTTATESFVSVLTTEGRPAFRTERERDCYRVLHTEGYSALQAKFGPEDPTASRLLNRWDQAGVARIVDDGRGSFTVKTFKKYAA